MIDREDERMDIKSANNKLGKRIRELLQDKSMSMRHLSKLTDIDTATISRIINGKRKANLNHLENFAKSLEVPVVDLIEAAGYRSKDNEEENRPGVEKELKYTKKLLAAYQIEEERLTMENIEQELKVHQEYSQTDEGRRMIITSFKEKLKKAGSANSFVQQLEDMYHRFRLQKGTKTEVTLLGGALIYFILTIDMIPDYMFAIGFLDDVLIVKYTMFLLKF